jgi:hypothetical protein
MKEPRDINWCSVFDEIEKDPTKKISEHLPDKKMTTVLEWLLMEKHLETCTHCQEVRLRVLAKAPPEKPNIASEN